MSQVRSSRVPLRAVLVLVICLVAMTAFPGTTHSAEVPWSFRRVPTPSGAPLESVAYGLGRWVAVGAAGTILRSEDGNTWIECSIPTTEDLSSVTFAGDKWVAVGNHGIILTSADSKSWWFEVSGVTDNLLAVAFGNGVTLVTGENGTVLTSKDNRTWTSQKLGQSSIWIARFLGNRFIVAEDKIYVSPDAMTWKPAQMGIDGASVYSVAYDGSRYVAAGSCFTTTISGDTMFVRMGSYLATSTDALTWTPLVSPGWLVRLDYVNRTFAALDSQGTILVSKDGVQWSPVTQVKGLFPNNIQNDGKQFLLCGTFGEIQSSLDGITWKPLRYANDIVLYALAKGKDTYVVVGCDMKAPNGDSRILTSPDGISWTLHPTKAVGLAAVTYGKDQFVAVGAGCWSSISPDGITWTDTRWLDTSEILYSITFGADKYVAVGDKGLIMVSADGKTAQKVISGQSNCLLGVTYANGTFVVVGQAGTILISTNGTTWNPVASGTTKNLFAINHLQGRFLAVGESGTGLSSVDGRNWTPVRMGTSEALKAVGYGAGQWVAAGDRGVIVTSADGVTWKQDAVPAGVWHPGVFGEANGVYVTGNHNTLLYKRSGSAPIAGPRLVLGVGRSTMAVSGGTASSVKLLDAVPVIQASRTFLPARPVVEALAGTISWVAAEQKVEIKKGPTTILLWIGRNDALLNGKVTQIDGNPEVRPYIAPPGRTMLPLRFIVESLGASVQWEAETQTITISEDSGVLVPATRADVAHLLAVRLGVEPRLPAQQTVPDVPLTHWAAGYIYQVMTRQSERNQGSTMPGYPDGTFKPEAQIHNAEIALLLCRTNLNGEARNIDVVPYSDVTQKHWSYNYVLEAARRGLIPTWVGNELFPDRPSTWLYAFESMFVAVRTEPTVLVDLLGSYIVTAVHPSNEKDLLNALADLKVSVQRGDTSARRAHLSTFVKLVTTEAGKSIPKTHYDRIMYVVSHL